jgi:anaerobic magnesium-protoporphyrin IX monomethyl ester cyclase
MGYLAAALIAVGQPVELVDYRRTVSELIATIRRAEPLVVGFSLIFQYYLPEYGRLIARLRAAGITAHLTMGGHYPSLCPDAVFDAIPELDSVALFEGEQTLVDLLDALERGDDWHAVPGLAYRANGELVRSAPRKLLADLDSLPYPYRPNEPVQALGWPIMPLLASRGCARRCSFCSIHSFYRQAEGLTVRLRRPERVADEMLHLANARGVRVFLFQDDDFPVWRGAGAAWARRFAAELVLHGLHDRIIWKISCRSEYVDAALFDELKQAGLYLVYMGIESGNSEGLRVLNKGITPQANLRAVDILKKLDLLVEYGFMMFDPSTTFDSIRSNLAFLRHLHADGRGGVGFCRMLPYGGTPIRDALRVAGRLRGDVQHPDYTFTDERVNQYHARLQVWLSAWLYGNGLSPQLNWAWHEVHLIKRLVGSLPDLGVYERELAALCKGSNDLLFDFVEAETDAYAAGNDSLIDPDPLRSERVSFIDRLADLRNSYIASHQQALLEAVRVSACTPIGPLRANVAFST